MTLLDTDYNIGATMTLNAAVWNNHTECVQRYIQKGFDISEVFLIHFDFKGKGVLCTNDYLTNEMKTVEGTVLKIAAFTGNLEMLKILLEAGLDVDDEYRDDTSPLMIAVMANNVNCVKYLIAAGADIGDRGKSSKHVMLLARSPACVQELMAGGCMINSKDTCGYTLLFFAARYGYLDLIRFLLDSGADTNEDYRWCNPLVIAAMCNQVDVVKILVKYGCDINQTHLGHKLYDTAITKNSVDVVKFLLMKDCQINNTPEGHELVGNVPEAPRKEMNMLLYAAGESFHNTSKADILCENKSNSSLQQLSREVIRSHLLSLNKRSSLFSRIPKLPIPNLMKRYLLYNVTLKGDLES